MLPEPGELEELLRLETLVRAKIRAAGVYGMEVEVIDGIESELRQYAERLAGGDVELLDDEDDGLSGAFLGEQLRAKLLRAQLEGELARIGAAMGDRRGFRQTAGGARAARPACSSPRARDRWTARRRLPLLALRRARRRASVLDSDLEMLRRIDPEGGEPADVDGRRPRRRRGRRAVGHRRGAQRARRPARRPGRDRPGAALRARAAARPDGDPPRGRRAGRRGARGRAQRAVRRALNEIAAETARGADLSQRGGRAESSSSSSGSASSPSASTMYLTEITEDDLGVVCWMAVLPDLCLGTARRCGRRIPRRDRSLLHELVVGLATLRLC